MSMNVYAMNYNNGSVQNQQSSTNDGTSSMVQNMQGREAYRQAKDGYGNSVGMQEAAEGQSYSDGIRMDTAIISKEGRLACSKISRQREEDQVKASNEAEDMIIDLSEYTDAELKQMYYHGEITLQEYEDETGEAIE